MRSGSEPPDPGRLLMLAGAALLAAGAAWKLGALRWFGRLPGDLRWESEDGGTRVFVPLTSLLAASIGLSGLAWLLAWASRHFNARS